MTEQAMSPLRRRMIEDMTIRKFAPKTQHDYVQRVKDFAAFLGRSPDTAKSEDVRCFRLHLASSGASAPKINATVSALRFFFNVTLDRPGLAKHLSFMHEPRKVPVVLSSEEVARFLEAAPSIKYKAALSVAYGAGLRVSEVVSLTVSDVDSKRMMLRVEQGKGRKDRHAMLSPVLLELLRDWYRVARPQGWLFPGQNPANPMTTRFSADRRNEPTAGKVNEFNRIAAPGSVRGKRSFLGDRSSVPKRDGGTPPESSPHRCAAENAASKSAVGWAPAQAEALQRPAPARAPCPRGNGAGANERVGTLRFAHPTALMLCVTRTSEFA